MVVAVEVAVTMTAAVAVVLETLASDNSDSVVRLSFFPVAY